MNPYKHFIVYLKISVLFSIFASQSGMEKVFLRVRRNIQSTLSVLIYAIQAGIRVKTHNNC